MLKSKVLMTSFVFVLLRPRSNEREHLKKRRLFYWFSCNSALEATWISLIRWPHKTSTFYGCICHFWMNVLLLDEYAIFGWICHFWMNLPFLDECAVPFMDECATLRWMCYFWMNVQFMDESAIYGRILFLDKCATFGKIVH